MNFHTDLEVLYRLLISFGIGTAIGIEREYRSKAAGLRSMIVICLGATIFTQISIGLGGPNNPDRIAASIISGIGFLGAGVIFKDGFTISGITTATTIWITAALGMAVGAGEYFTAIIGGAIVLVVLVIFENLKNILESLRQTRLYKISVTREFEFERSLNLQLNTLQLGFYRKRDFKTEKHYIVMYEVFGSEEKLNQFNEYLRSNVGVHTFEY